MKCNIIINNCKTANNKILPPTYVTAGYNNLVMLFEVAEYVALFHSQYLCAVFASGAFQFFYAVAPTLVSRNMLQVPLIPLTTSSVIGLSISVSYANTTYYSLINSDPFGLPACSTVLIPPSQPPTSPTPSLNPPPPLNPLPPSPSNPPPLTPPCE